MPNVTEGIQDPFSSAYPTKVAGSDTVYPTKVVGSDTVCSTQVVGSDVDYPAEVEIAQSDGENDGDEPELNEFQRRRKMQQQKLQQEHHQQQQQQGIKRTIGCAEKIITPQTQNTKNENVNENKNTDTQPERPHMRSQSREPDSFVARRLQQKEERQIERQMERERDTVDSILRRIAPRKFVPEKEVEGSVFKQRYVNQLFVRGDNIVMVAYERPEDWKKIQRLKEKEQELYGDFISG